MITAQRLPYKFFWDEEGHGAQFEARPLAVDSASFRLLIQCSLEDAPWVDAELDPKAVVDAFLAPLEDFSLHHRFFSSSEWAISKSLISRFKAFQERQIPLPLRGFSPRKPRHFNGSG